MTRRDTQAVTAIVRTMADIGEKYAEARRDSMFLMPDFTAGMPIGVSDIANVLNPIYESIKRICEDAAKQSNEAVVQGCLATLGHMAAHAMTMVHTSELQRTAPLAYAPVFYVEQCVKAALPAGMDDALLAAIEGTRKVFAKISDEHRHTNCGGRRARHPPHNRRRGLRSTIHRGVLRGGRDDVAGGAKRACPPRCR